MSLLDQEKKHEITTWLSLERQLIVIEGCHEIHCKLWTQNFGVQKCEFVDFPWWNQNFALPSFASHCFAFYCIAMPCFVLLFVDIRILLDLGEARGTMPRNPGNAEEPWENLRNPEEPWGRLRNGKPTLRTLRDKLPFAIGTQLESF